jgi:hypothetical protein
MQKSNLLTDPEELLDPAPHHNKSSAEILRDAMRRDGGIIDYRITGERAELFVPKGVRRKDLRRCPGCGGLVKMPCLTCKVSQC